MKSDEHTIPPRRETEKTGRYRAASAYGDTTPPSPVGSRP